MSNDICPHEASAVTYEDTKNGKQVTGKVCVRCGAFKAQPRLGFIEWLLTKVFPYTDILRDGTNDIYLRRFFIYPRDKDFGKNVGKGRIYLHKFYRGDEDPHLHDHPWPFTSLILTKGYWEETRDEDAYTASGYGKHWTYTLGPAPDREHRVQKWYRPFSLLRRPATWKHRVILDNGEPVWTLVKTGVKERSWGFWIMGKLCPWRNYNDGICWCEPQADNKEAMLTEQGVTIPPKENDGGSINEAEAQA